MLNCDVVVAAAVVVAVVVAAIVAAVVAAAIAIVVVNSFCVFTSFCFLIMLLLL